MCDLTPDHNCEIVCFPDYDGAIVAYANLPTCVTPGAKFNFSITMRNSGTTTWSAADGYNLGAVGDEDPFAASTRVVLPPDATVPPLGTHTFQVAMTAPSETRDDYLSDWQMVRESVAWFGIPFAGRIAVKPACDTPVVGGDYFCKVSVQHADGSPSPGKPVFFDAYALDSAVHKVRVDHQEGQTGVDGQVTVPIVSPYLVDQLVCTAHNVRTNQAFTKIVTQRGGIPRGTTLTLDLTEVPDYVPRRYFPGLKRGNAEVFHIPSAGPNHKPVVVPMPFDPGERTSRRFTFQTLKDKFKPFLVPANAADYDVWLVMTESGQNIHEQAAELAQVIDYVAGQHGPDGKTIVAGYSLGGLTARIATARWESDLSWRQAVGVRAELPVSLIAYGDSPLEGAQANVCLQEGLFRLRKEDLFNLNSCAAQQLLRETYPGFPQDPAQNHYAFFRDAGVVSFSNRLNSRSDCVMTNSSGSPCDCEAGPAVWKLGLDRNGYARTRAVAFSGGMRGNIACYGDARDLNREGANVCGSTFIYYPQLPHELQEGELLYRVQQDVDPPFTRLCYANNLDVEGGSRLSGAVGQRQCRYLFFCGGVDQFFAGTFIPFSSALPPDAPFANTQSNTFQGVHAYGYSGEPELGSADEIGFLLDEFSKVTASAAPTKATAGTSSLATSARLEVRPVDSVSGTTPVTLTLPHVIQEGATTLTTSSTGPAPFPRYVHGTPSTYYELATTTLFEATPNDPITVCIDYSGMTFVDEHRLELFHYENVGWVDVTTVVDTNGKRVCGSTTSLSPFALFEPENHDPMVDAGQNQTVEATSASGAEVVLSGALSIDPDLEELTFEWQDGGGAVLATSEVARATVSLGTHHLTLQAHDPRGGTGSASVLVKVQDTTPPTVSLTAPVGGAFLAGKVVLAADASDAVGVVGVQFLLDGRPVAAEVASAPYSVTWDTKTVADGPHTLRALARDAAGNVGRAAPVKVTVDNTPPTLTLAATPAVLWPPNNKLVTITMAVSAKDNITANPKVQLVSISCDDGCNPASDIVGAVYGADVRQFALRATRLGSGSGRTYKITYSAADQAGNVTTAMSIVYVPHDQR